MNLRERLNASPPAAPALVPAAALQSEQPQDETGLHRFTAEFFTAFRTLRAELASLEVRLSDCLNSSSPVVEVRRFEVGGPLEGTVEEPQGRYAQFTKARILFVLPIDEPRRALVGANPAWRQTITRECRLGVGPFEISGKVHAEPGRDLRVSLRMLDKQFMPVTQASVRFPDGVQREYPAVLVNRKHIDLVALDAF